MTERHALETLLAKVDAALAEPDRDPLVVAYALIETEFTFSQFALGLRYLSASLLEEHPGQVATGIELAGWRCAEWSPSVAVVRPAEAA